MTRVVSGAALIVLAIAAVWFASPPVFLAIAGVLLFIASYELVALAHAGGLKVPRVVSVLAAGFTFVAVVVPISTSMLPVTLTAGFLAVAFIALGSWRGGPNALATVAASMLPSIYLALPIAALVGTRRDGGPEGLFLLMLTVIVSDTAQYYTGRAFGKTLLAPVVSPKKTVEGATGGFVFGTLTLAIVGHWWLPNVPVGVRVTIGIAIVAMGIAGDLFESMLKRSASVKDSSAIIPGHGGVLDRIDALLFAAPVYYLLLRYV